MLNQILDDEIKCLKKKSIKNQSSIILVKENEFENWHKNLTDSQQNWVQINDFKASKSQQLIFQNEKGNIDFIAIGCGNSELTPWFYAKVAGNLPEGTYSISNDLNTEEANLATFGWAMAHYSFDLYKKEKKEKTASLVIPDATDKDEILAIIKGTILTRNLVNIPACDMGPDELTEVSQKIAKKHKAKFKLTKGEELLEKGYRTIHTVGRAAKKEPCLIDIRWGKKNAPKVTLVGKGVCFDTGGLDIKPSSAMLTMKKDMGGAAHVLGLGQMIMETGLDIQLRILIPAVENNISGDAFRPGDIIKSYQGTTIEVGNTDAEGRLILCDALALASEEEPELIIDYATLTGAARVALGPDVPPFFTDDNELKTELPKHADQNHDPLWELPLYQPYKELLSSSAADLNNIGSTGFGGAITAALFLKHFVGKDIPWMHLDVYAWNPANKPGRPKGGEAMGIRAVFSFLKNKFGPK